MQIQTAGLIKEKMCESQSWLYFQYVEKKNSKTRFNTG